MRKFKSILLLSIGVGTLCFFTQCHKHKDNGQRKHGGHHHSAIEEVNTCDYHDNSGRDDLLAGGIKMIPVETPKGTFKVWTKRIGNNPKIKVLLLHGGPGLTHEIYESFDSYFPGAGIEYYYCLLYTSDAADD